MAGHEPISTTVPALGYIGQRGRRAQKRWAGTTNMADFTPLQGQYLAFIDAYSKIHGTPPAEADLQRFFQVTPPSVHQMILTLDRLGLISRVPGAPRSIRLRVPEDEIPRLEGRPERRSF